MNARKPDGRRNKLLARVHIAKKALGLDEDTYRSMLMNSWRAQSAAELDDGTLENLARSLERSSGTAPRPQSYPGRPRNMDRSGSRGEQLGKIEALLAEAKYPWSYADTLAARICKVQRIAWVETDDLYKIIAALVKDAQRKGRVTR